MKFFGKTALVTGASRGIGRAIALELAQQGADCVMLVARDAKRLGQLAAELETCGTKAIAIPLDLTQSIDVDIAIARAWRNHGPIDLLVNCAGVAYQAPFLEARREHIQEELAVNLLGMYTITQPVAKRMAAKGKGKIVNVSSLMGKLAAPTMATYGASKFAVLGFTQSLRHELAVHNVEVSALLPSLTDTDMTRQFQRFKGVTAHTPQQVAQVLSHHLSGKSSEVFVGWQSRLAVWTQRFAPWLVDYLIKVTAPRSLPNDLGDYSYDSSDRNMLYGNA
jgi:3-oxoacyl-[acyl-carrier protein] reductase